MACAIGKTRCFMSSAIGRPGLPITSAARNRSSRSWIDENKRLQEMLVAVETEVPADEEGVLLLSAPRRATRLPTTVTGGTPGMCS